MATRQQNEILPHLAKTHSLAIFTDRKITRLWKSPQCLCRPVGIHSQTGRRRMPNSHPSGKLEWIDQGMVGVRPARPRKCDGKAESSGRRTAVRRNFMLANALALT